MLCRTRLLLLGLPVCLEPALANRTGLPGLGRDSAGLERPRSAELGRTRSAGRVSVGRERTRSVFGEQLRKLRERGQRLRCKPGRIQLWQPIPQVFLEQTVARSRKLGEAGPSFWCRGQTISVERLELNKLVGVEREQSK